MSGRKRRRIWVGTALIGLLGTCLVLDSRLVNGEDGYAAVGNSIDEYIETLKLLTTSYYKPLASDSLTTSAIEGMLDELDPYTQMLNRRGLDDLMIDTQGKFGGLGITISTMKRNGVEVPVVLSVIEGTPADTSGLVVGDRIVKVDGDPTLNRKLEEVVDVLRGNPGNRVVITIERPGRSQPFDQEIIRARIRVKSVASIDGIEEGIGYIAMSGLIGSRFSESTPVELKAAVDELKAKNARGIILDLRGNPGGLLAQAVAVADVFLGPDLLVVTTRGRVDSQNKEYRTAEASRVKDIPLVVLVNSHSASASEIVAGAIQDSDRGLILGTPTFGKGSVQSFQRVSDEKALKWTTALYYTPSGRSIHKNRRFGRLGNLALNVGDSQVPLYQTVATIAGEESREDAITRLFEQFDLESTKQAEQLFETELGQMLGMALREDRVADEVSDSARVFKTAGGRTVYGGGGITPDVVVKPERRPRLILEMYRAGLFFDFAVEYAARTPFPRNPEGYEVGEKEIAAFRAFLADSSKLGNFRRYRTPAQNELENLNKALEAAGLDADADQALEILRNLVESEREAEFEKAEPFIRMEIGRELGNRVWGRKGRILARLKGDEQFHEAVRILRDPERYRKSMKLALAGNSGH